MGGPEIAPTREHLRVPRRPRFGVGGACCPLGHPGIRGTRGKARLYPAKVGLGISVYRKRVFLAGLGFLKKEKSLIELLAVGASIVCQRHRAQTATGSGSVPGRLRSCRRGPVAESFLPGRGMRTFLASIGCCSSCKCAC